MTNVTDADRIWACMDGPMVGLFVSGGNHAGWPEYIRADIAATAEQSGYDRAIAEVVAWLRSNAMGGRWRELAEAIEAGEYKP